MQNQVLDGKLQFVEMTGNLLPIAAAGDQHYVSFKAFKDNRLPFTVRIPDIAQEATGLLHFYREPKSKRGTAASDLICTLKVTLPDVGVTDLQPPLSENGDPTLHICIYNFFIILKFHMLLLIWCTLMSTF